MPLPGATHRGAPFTGRRRELGVLIQLLREGLEGAPPCIRVAGTPGSGRRRLIHEALLRGPDAEWIELAPGGLEADFDRWLQTEFVDLLESYPRAPIPSWCFHVLGHRVSALRRFAPVPALSPETFPRSDFPERLGSAVGVAVRAFTSESTVVVDAGLWPAAGTPRERSLNAMIRALGGAGVVVITAVDDDHPAVRHSPEIHTLALGSLSPAEITALAESWSGGTGAGRFASRFARWLHRVTGGHSLFLHETVRWLEELGHVHVDDDLGTVQLLDPTGNLPLPLGLRSVMENRFRRLPPPAAYLMSRIAAEDNAIDLDVLRDAYEGPEEGFQEALAALRRRSFLLRRSMRHPVALTSSLWKDVAVAPSRRKFRRTRLPARDLEPLRKPRAARSALARALAETGDLYTAMREDVDAAPAARTARLLRAGRRRTGPAWNGVQGRAAVLAAVVRMRQGRTGSAIRWTSWGRGRLAPDRHPALRRSLGLIALRAHEQSGRAAEAGALRGEMLQEALAAGHLATAARIRAAHAEGIRRLGRLSEAVRQATLARRDLSAMGDAATASLAAYTRVRALTDCRRLEEALRDVREPGAEFRVRSDEFAELEKSIVDIPAMPEFFGLQYSHPAPRGWGYGLEDNRLVPEARALIVRFAAAVQTGTARTFRAAVDRLVPRLERAGLTTDRADFAELDVFASLAAGDAGGVDAALARTADLHDRLGSVERSRFLASALHRTPAGAAPVFTARFRPLLLQPAPRTRVARAAPELRVHLLGRGRIEHGSRIRPLPLWPEWWTRLLGCTVAHDFLDRPLLDDGVRDVLAQSGEPAGQPLDEVLVLANRNLWQNDSGAGRGGFRRRDGRWSWEWGAIWCDARTVFENLARSRRLDESGNGRAADRARDTALAAVAGSFLPKLDSPEILETRARLAVEVLEALQNRLQRTPALAWECYADWLEGPGRLVALDRLIASRLESQGLSRAARALRSGSAYR